MMHQRRYAGFRDLTPPERRQTHSYADDKQIAEVTSIEAAHAVQRLMAPVRTAWWQGWAGGSDFANPAYLPVTD